LNTWRSRPSAEEKYPSGDLLNILGSNERRHYNTSSRRIPRMAKFKLLLLDANVVIQLFRFGIWDQLVERCHVHLARTVVKEAHFFKDENGERVDFDVAPDADAGRLSVFEVSAKNIERFSQQFEPLFLERPDAGEAESLAYLVSLPPESRLCSSDAIVFRVLGALNLAERGISLEELLPKVGLGRAVPYRFSRRFRQKWTQEGFDKNLRRMGRNEG
jgi:hypothetical protein